MAQNQRQILMLMALIVAISVNNIAQALNINPDACAILFNNLKSNFRRELANNDPQVAIQFIMNLLKGEFFFLRDQCIEDFPELDQKCLSQIAKHFLNLISNSGDFNISPNEVSTIIDQDNELPRFCPSA